MSQLSLHSGASLFCFVHGLCKAICKKMGNNSISLTLEFVCPWDLKGNGSDQPSSQKSFKLEK